MRAIALLIALIAGPACAADEASDDLRKALDLRLEQQRLQQQRSRPQGIFPIDERRLPIIETPGAAPAPMVPQSTCFVLGNMINCL